MFPTTIKNINHLILSFLTVQDKARLCSVSKAAQNALEEYLDYLTSFKRKECSTAVQITDIEELQKKSSEALFEGAKQSMWAKLIVSTPTLFSKIKIENRDAVQKRAKDTPRVVVKNHGK